MLIKRRDNCGEEAMQRDLTGVEKISVSRFKTEYKRVS
jgi:hypothetical protein